MCVEPQTVAHIHRRFACDIGTPIITCNHKLAAHIQGLSERTIHIRVYTCTCIVHVRNLCTKWRVKEKVNILYCTNLCTKQAISKEKKSPSYMYVFTLTSVVMVAILLGEIVPLITLCFKFGFFKSPKLDTRLRTHCLYLLPVSRNSE